MQNSNLICINLHICLRYSKFDALQKIERSFSSMQKTIELSYLDSTLLSNDKARRAGVQVHAIQFTFMKTDIRTCEMRITM